MKIAVVSDIHANLQAWKAVLLDIRSLGADLIVCLGDVIGYGPDPAAVVESVCAHVNQCVMGNHDAAVCGKIGLTQFSAAAAESIEWTRDRLGRSALAYFRALPLTLSSDQFRCAHGDFSAPAHFRYVSNPEDALLSWKTVADRLLFVGHTHQPRIAVLGTSQTSHFIDPVDFTLEDHKRYIVNVGSVGHPRDGDVRASYCLYDLEQSTVYWRRIPFDIDAYRAALSRSGASESWNPFLASDPLGGPGRQKLLGGFTPSIRAEDRAQDVEEVHALKLLRARVRHWRLAACVLAALCAGAVGWALWLWAGRTPETVARKWDVRTVAIHAFSRPAETNLLSVPVRPQGTNTPVEGWSVRVADDRRQSVRVTQESEGQAVFELRSEAAESEMLLTSHAVMAEPGTKFMARAMFRKSPDFSGNVTLRVRGLPRIPGFNGAASGFMADRAEGGRYLCLKEAHQARKGRWLEARQTFELPVPCVRLECQVGGSFKGSVEIKEITLVRKRK